MTRQAQDPQPSLFDEERPNAELKPAQRTELAAVLETLIAEIAAALANAKRRENTHE